MDRYERQIQLKEIGTTGQEILSNSKVLVVGAGGLGSPAIYYLAAAGIGTIGLCDYDKVSLSNLNRQILHFNDDIGEFKTMSAKNKINKFNPDILVQTYCEKLDATRALDLFYEYDIILSCVDNIDTRYILNDAHISTRRPLIDAAVQGFSGYIFPIIDGYACYNCVYPKEDLRKVTSNAIIGATAGVLGSIQALEAIKTLLGHNSESLGKILFIDLLNYSFDRINVEKNDACYCKK